MEIICLQVGSLQTNCYLVTDPATSQTLIIDPGDEADFISTTILENKLTPQAIVLTHGHYDHCLGVLELKLNFNLPIYLHQADNFLYQKSFKSAEHWSKSSVIPGLTRNLYKLTPPPIDHFLKDNQIITFGNSSLQVIHTPGHTPGSICLYSKPKLFTGDTLFASGPGTADKSYSSKTDFQKSLQKLTNLPNPILIYPGHEDYEVTFFPKLFS